MDIIILLLCTFLIINRLMKMLGQYDAEQDKSRQGKNTVIIDLFKQKYYVNNNEKTINAQVTSVQELKLSETIRSTLNDIRSQDNEFDFDRFINGVRKAYGMCFQAIQENNLDVLKNLVDAELLETIKRNNKKADNPMSILNIDNIEVVDAALFGPCTAFQHRCRV